MTGDIDINAELEALARGEWHAPSLDDRDGVPVAIRVLTPYDGTYTSTSGYATRNHPRSSYGQPVILIDGTAHGASDITAPIWTADAAVYASLSVAGYNMGAAHLGDPENPREAGRIIWEA